jgi:hypothetical protein
LGTWSNAPNYAPEWTGNPCIAWWLRILGRFCAATRRTRGVRIWNNGVRQQHSVRLCYLLA